MDSTMKEDLSNQILKEMPSPPPPKKLSATQSYPALPIL